MKKPLGGPAPGYSYSGFALRLRLRGQPLLQILPLVNCASTFSQWFWMYFQVCSRLVPLPMAVVNWMAASWLRTLPETA